MDNWMNASSSEDEAEEEGNGNAEDPDETNHLNVPRDTKEWTWEMTFQENLF